MEIFECDLSNTSCSINFQRCWCW